MAVELNKQETEAVSHSLKKYFESEFEIKLGEIQTRALLQYILLEIAPFAYNQGVKDSENFFRSKVEDLPATCFQDGLTYWLRKKK